MKSEEDSNWNSREKHSIPITKDDSSPRKRSRPSSTSQQSNDQSDDEPYSPSQHDFQRNEQKVIRQPHISLRESTLISTGQPTKAILQLLQDDDDDDDDNDEEEEDEAYSPSQLNRETMDEVSDQLKEIDHAKLKPIETYVPPTPILSHDEFQYKDKIKSNDNIGSNCRLIPIHGESTSVIDPRLRIYSSRLRSKVRQLVFERLPSSDDLSDRNEFNEEFDHLVECHGRRLYWYRVICFLQNISLTTNSPKQIQFYFKELSRLLVLTPNISKILKIKQKYPKMIPFESKKSSSLKDPRSPSFQTRFIQYQKLQYH